MSEQNSLPVQALPDGSAELRLVLHLRWEDIAALGREAGRMAAQLKRPVGLDEAASQRLSTWSTVTSSTSPASATSSSSTSATPVAPAAVPAATAAQASARHRAAEPTAAASTEQAAVRATGQANGSADGAAVGSAASLFDAAGDRAARVSSLTNRTADPTRATG